MMPTWLGGNGQCINAYLSSPFLTEDTFGMKIFYLVAFGKNLNRLITHAFIRTEGTFYEYLLHHGLATFLIIFSYLMNYWLIGIFIIFIHDLSDFAVGAGRLYTVIIILLRTIVIKTSQYLKYCMSSSSVHGLFVVFSFT
jgi:hypothetical protein